MSVTQLPFVLTAVIANGASLSGSVDLDGYGVVAIEMPAAWTAASLTFQGSLDGTTFYNLYDEAGFEVELTAATASRIIRLDPARWAGMRYIKLRSGTSGAAVNQLADRSIRIQTRRLW